MGNVLEDKLSVVTEVKNQQDQEGEGVHTPEFKLEVTYEFNEDCIYVFNFKARNLSDKKDLTNVKFTYELGDNLTWISSTDVALIPTEWNVDNLSKNQSITKQATIKYTGDVDQADKLILGNIMGTAKYDGNKDAEYKGIYEYKHDVVACPGTECCEDCPVESNPVLFTQCDQSLAVDIEPTLTSEGKEIKVHVRVNPVCVTKDVVVGIELYEKVDENTTIRRALKVVKLAAMEGEPRCDMRECDCVTFYIPPKDEASDDPTCDQQTFIVKAKAHHYNIETGCECSTCNALR